MIVITGTGRSGSTFLMRLFTNLGYNTGWTKAQAEEEFNRHEGLRGGIESNWNSKADVVKNPEFARDPKRLIETFNPDKVIVPIRNLESTAKSREYQGNQGKYGGFWHASTVAEQMEFNAYLIYHLTFEVSKTDIDLIFVEFERMIEDWDYLYFKLQLKVDVEKFRKAHLELADKTLIRF